VKNVSYKVMAFIGLSIGAKMIGGGDPFYLKLWVKVTVLELFAFCEVNCVI